jgi:ubiE/COQ5 methyltransferase family
MEQKIGLNAQEQVLNVTTPENRTNPYMEEKAPVLLTGIDLQNKISNTEKQLTVDIKVLDEIRAKLGLPPATNAEIKNIPAFANNLNNLKILREMDRNGFQKIPEVSIPVEKSIKEDSLSTKSVEVVDIKSDNFTNLVIKQNGGVEREDAQVIQNEGIKVPTVSEEENVQTFNDIVSPIEVEGVEEVIGEVVGKDVIREGVEISNLQQLDIVEAIPDVDHISDSQLQITDVGSVKNEQAGLGGLPKMIPSQNLEYNSGALESREKELIQVESVKDFINAYRNFFDNLLKYNESTLTRDGNETSESILYNADIYEIIKSLDVGNEIVNEETAKKAAVLMGKVRDFFMDNIFPVQGGMSASSLKGYDFLQDSILDLKSSLGIFYNKLQESGQVEKFQQFATQIDNDLMNLEDSVSKKRMYTESYLSR